MSLLGRLRVRAELVSRITDVRGLRKLSPEALEAAYVDPEVPFSAKLEFLRESIAKDEACVRENEEAHAARMAEHRRLCEDAYERGTLPPALIEPEECSHLRANAEKWRGYRSVTALIRRALDTFYRTHGEPAELQAERRRLHAAAKKAHAADEAASVAAFEASKKIDPLQDAASKAWEMVEALRGSIEQTYSLKIFERGKDLGRD